MTSSSADNDHFTDFALLAGASLLAFVAALQLLVSLSFIAGAAVGPAHAPGAMLTATAFLAWGARRRWPTDFLARTAALIALLATTVGGALLVAGTVIDFSYDGQSYHQSAVVQLAGGWNPLQRALTDADTINAHWDNHYAKGPWLVGAALYSLTGRIQQARAMNLVLIVASFWLVLAALRALTPRRSLPGPVLAGLAALNPVAVCQALTFYVDGQLASLLTSLVALAFLVLARPGPVVGLALASALLALANIKFTGLVYAVLFGGGPALALLLARRTGWRAQAGWAAAGLAAGMLVVGFNPYLTNLRERGHPFFPLAGKGAINIVANQIPAAFHQKNRVEKLARSLFSDSHNDYAQTDRLKLPFAVTRNELKAFGAPDARLGGFGPWFSGALLLAAALVALRLRGRWEAGRALAITAALLAVTVLVNPEPWWARYSPQLWLLPLLALVGIRTAGRKERALGLALALTLAADVALVAGANLAQTVRNEQAAREQLRGLAARMQPVRATFFDMESGRLRLAEAGIGFVEVRAEECGEAVPLVGARGLLCGREVRADERPRENQLR